MTTVIVIIVLVVLAVVLGTYLSRNRANARAQELADAKAEARRWVERLGGQVMNLVGTDAAAKQAVADAAERYTAAGSQLEQATTVRQAQLTTRTALEGLYYVRAARLAMDIDPGPDLPESPDQRGAGAVDEQRSVNVEGHDYEASPNPSDQTPHYYPGGRVAGRPVPRGWYSEPWWRPALTAGVWGVGSFLLFDAMFSGMAGIPSAQAWEQGYDAGQADAGDGGDYGDGGGDGGDGGDAGSGGDWGGGDGDWGGGDVGGDWGGGDMGGF
ncbi:MAG TPA: hypothetical protein VHV49_20900 [Pseudonocardiaceae bacterium]|nr:hypothetical protein [Pseudonocardiaceae bacterium]